jgi:hypothetical protein
MRAGSVFLIIVTLTVLRGLAAVASDVTRIALSPPTDVVQLDMAVLKGEPWRLSWSPDGTQIHLQTGTGDPFGHAEVRNYLITLKGSAPKAVDAEPEWAASSWALKSGPMSPGMPSFRIQVEEEIPATADHSNRDEPPLVHSLTLKGVLIAKGTAVVPGRTYGWAPAGTNLIAFVDETGALVLMDSRGGTLAVPGVADALLPTWSDDGTWIAFVRKIGMRSYAVSTVNVIATP